MIILMMLIGLGLLLLRMHIKEVKVDYEERVNEIKNRSWLISEGE